MDDILFQLFIYIGCVILLLGSFLVIMAIDCLIFYFTGKAPFIALANWFFRKINI